MMTPEMFGARGDGRTNDTDAFAAMSAYVNARGGGTIALRPVTYIVGKQARSRGDKAELAFAPSDIIHLSGCNGTILIRGNDARLLCAPRLRYGAFDRRSGAPLLESKANLDLDKRASPYLGMIHAEQCSGSVGIFDLELDGNLRQLVIGGKYGPGGWQAGGTGILLTGNTGPERLARINSHHHPQDGIQIAGRANRIPASIISDVLCEFNGRQGCSLTGGRNYVFERCRFRHTGKGGMWSAPAAGVDIEAEATTIRNVVFRQCEFSDNWGFGMDAGSGDSEGLAFEGCTFIGTTNYSAWPDRPGMRFSGCVFVGSINHAHGDVDPARAAQFVDCTLTDDPALSPTGKVFLPGQGKWIAIVLQNPNVLFSRCHFRLIGAGVLPLSEDRVIYADCDMSQHSPAPSGPQGTYLGTNSIRGNAHVEGSIIRGNVILNGRLLPTTA